MTGPPAVPPVSLTDAPSRPHRGPLVSAAIVTVAWCVMLITMAWLTANPVTLNRDQILRADFVVTGKVESEPASVGQVAVSREWKTNGLSGTIHVENLAEAKARPGATYLIPLSRSTTGYRVTDARLDDGAPMIYPETPTAIEQLEAILPDHAAAK